MTFLLSLARSRDAVPPERGLRVQRLADRAAAPATRAPTGTRLGVAGGAELALSGEIDLSTRDLLTGAARQLRDGRGRYRHDVVMHMDGVTFIDATGLGALVELSSEVGADGMRLRLVGAGRGLRRLSGVCGLDAVLGLDPV